MQLLKLANKPFYYYLGPNYNIVFKDVFPVSLGVINFDTNNTDLEPIIVDASFKYPGTFEVDKLV